MNQPALSIAVRTALSVYAYSTVSKCVPSGSIVPFVLVLLWSTRYIFFAGTGLILSISCFLCLLPSTIPLCLPGHTHTHTQTDRQTDGQTVGQCRKYGKHFLAVMRSRDPACCCPIMHRVYNATITINSRPDVARDDARRVLERRTRTFVIYQTLKPTESRVQRMGL